MHLAIQNRTLTSTQSETNACVDDSEEVLIPEGVEMIGRNAFLCCNEISHVQLPESLTAIHAGAFQHCYNLKEIRIPEHVEEIHEEAFAYCMKIEKLMIPIKTRYIGKNVFSSCSALSAVYVDAENPCFCDADGVLYDKQKKTLLRFPPAKEIDIFTVPDGVEEIAEGAFQGCSLSVLTLPASLCTVGKDAFSRCELLHSIRISPENPHFYTENGVLFLRENNALFCYPAGKQQTEYTIPNGTKGIGADAFLQPLGKHEDTLQTIRIPASVESIRGSAFDALTELCAIDVSEDNPCFCDAYGVLYTKDMTEIVRFPIDYPCSCYTLPDSVKRIGDCAFRSCGDLDEIEFPDGLEEIGAYGLSCYDLKLRSLPQSLVRIGKGAFVGLHRLIQLEIPLNVRQLSGEIVDECPILSRIILHHRRDGIALEEKTFYGFTGEILYITDRMQLLLPSSILEDDWYDDEQYYVLFFLTCTEESGKHSFYFSKVEKPYKSLLAVWAIVHLQEPLDPYVEYLQEDDEGIRMLIERQDYPNLAKVLEYPVITEGNIESLLQFAIDHKDTEATILLLHYKKKQIGFSDTEEAFSL